MPLGPWRANGQKCARAPRLARFSLCQITTAASGLRGNGRGALVEADAGGDLTTRVGARKVAGWGAKLDLRAGLHRELEAGGAGAVERQSVDLDPALAT